MQVGAGGFGDGWVFAEEFSALGVNSAAHFLGALHHFLSVS